MSDNVVMFPFQKTKRVQEQLALGNKVEPPKGFAETKARVERLKARPKYQQAVDFATSAGKQITDTAFESVIRISKQLNKDPELASKLPGNLADLHFLVNSFLTDALKSTIMQEEYKSTFAVSDPDFNDVYRKKVKTLLESAAKGTRKPKS